jgi:hypothetical protein
MSAPTAKAVARLKYQLYDAMIRDGGPSVLQLRVAWRLIDRTNRETGDAWPSYETLADELGVNVRSVIRAIKRLIETGWFGVNPGGGRGKSNHYRPCWQRVTDEPPFTATETVTGEAINSDSRGKKTVTGESPEPVREPLKESDRASDLLKTHSEAAVGRSGQNGESVINGTAVNARQGDQRKRQGRGCAGNDRESRTAAIIAAGQRFAARESRGDCGDSGADTGENFDAWIDLLVEKKAFTDESYGFGAGHAGAQDAVDRLRKAAGDKAAMRCLEDGQARRLFGHVLRRHVESRATWHEERQQRAAG